MARKAQENPQLDMTPMIDVVFELIIFFVVTLTEAQKKDETIELEDGKHGVVISPETLPAQHIQIDISSKGRISMGDMTITESDIIRRIKDRQARGWGEFPVLIRADFATQHVAVRKVMDACAAAGLAKISFMAIQEDKTDSRKRLRRTSK